MQIPAHVPHPPFPQKTEGLYAYGKPRLSLTAKATGQIASKGIAYDLISIYSKGIKNAKH